MSFKYRNENFLSSPMFLKVGIVKSLDNSKDQTRTNRVLVSFLNEDSECYAYMMYNYFGKEFGRVWYPDEGTIVVVAFIENCIDGAVIIGCLNKYENDLLPISKENHQDVFKHKNGILVDFHNKEKESKIIVKTKEDKEQITIDLENEKIEVINKSEDLKIDISLKESKLNAKIKQISVEANEGINIKSKNINIELNEKLTLKGSGIEMNSSGNIKIESNSGTEIKSSGMININ